MRKIIEKIKEKGVKLSARIFGAMTACFQPLLQHMPTLRKLAQAVYGHRQQHG